MATWNYPGGQADTAFGAGESNNAWAPQTYCYGAAITLPAGTVLRLRAFTHTTNTAGMTLKLGLYNSGGTLVVQGSVGMPTIDVKQWVDVDVADTAISAGTYYVLGSGSTESLSYGYSTTGDGSYATGAYASAMAASLTISSDDANKNYGVAAEVEEGSSANAPSVNDAVTASEDVTLRMHLQNMAVHDAVTVTESVTLSFNVLVVSVFDDVTVADVFGEISNDLYPVVSDDILVQDSPAIQPAVLSVAVEAYDIVIVNEGQEDTNNVFPSVFDAITLDESVGINLTLLRVTVFDVVTVVDAPGIFAQGPLGVVTFDSVTVQEFVNRYMSLYINAFDNVSVIDGAWAPDVFDAVTLTEDITVKLAQLLISVSDTVTLEESLELFGTALNLTTFEELPIEESVTVFLSQLTPSVSDNVTLTESVTVSISTIDLTMGVYDDVTVSEDVDAQENPILLDEFTEILVEDVSIPLMNYLYIDISEDVSVAESIDVRVLPILFNVSDDVSVTERVAMRLSKGGRRRPGLLTMGAGE